MCMCVNGELTGSEHQYKNQSNNLTHSYASFKTLMMDCEHFQTFSTLYSKKGNTRGKKKINITINLRLFFRNIAGIYDLKKKL